MPPKDFARQTAIKPVAPCRGDFYADIFSVSSFVPHRSSRLSLSFSLFRSRVPSLPVLHLPRHRYHSLSVSLSFSRRPSVNSSSFLSFHRAAHRHGQFRGCTKSRCIRARRARLHTKILKLYDGRFQIRHGSSYVSWRLRKVFLSATISILISKKMRANSLRLHLLHLASYDYFLLAKLRLTLTRISSGYYARVIRS